MRTDSFFLIEGRMDFQIMDNTESLSTCVSYISSCLSCIMGKYLYNALTSKKKKRRQSYIHTVIIVNHRKIYMNMDGLKITVPKLKWLL